MYSQLIPRYFVILIAILNDIFLVTFSSSCCGWERRC